MTYYGSLQQEVRQRDDTGDSSSSRLDTLLHAILSSTLSRSTTLPSSCTQSIHRFLSRPLFIVPDSLGSVAHLTNSFPPFSSRGHNILVYFLVSRHLQSFLIRTVSSFLVLSRLVAPLIARRHLISSISNFITCSSVIVQVSVPKRSPVLPSFCTPASSVSLASVGQI
jgi:hypothetical protein